MTWRGVLAAALAVALGGCGYRLAGGGADLPREARTISIKLFTNNARDPGSTCVCGARSTRSSGDAGRCASCRSPGAP
jgi:hypothetical protein